MSTQPQTTETTETPFQGMKPLPFMLYTIAEAAQILRLHRNTVEIAIRKGHLKGVHKGRKILIHIDELERFAKRDIPVVQWRAGATFPRRRGPRAVPSPKQAAAR